MNKKSCPGQVTRQAVSITSFVAGLGCADLVQAGATFKIDDAKWLSIGAGVRTSLAFTEDSAGRNGDKWSKDFLL